MSSRAGRFRLQSRFLLLVVLLGPAGLSAAVEEPPVIPIWPGTPPGSSAATGPETVRVNENGEHIVSNVHRPSLTVYLPHHAAATSVLVLPGGGHRELWVDHEGYNVARWLRDRGIAAFVLKYRLARQEGSPYTIEEHEVADALRALRLIRARAQEWKIDPRRIGVIGFSAGGELAARTALAGDDGNAGAPDPIARQSSRVAFQALIYPANPDIIQPVRGSPPAFLCWGFGDRAEIVQGVGAAYLRFVAAGVPVEMHEYSESGHGFGLRPGDTSPAGKWIERFHEWLGSRGWLRPPAD